MRLLACIIMLAGLTFISVFALSTQTLPSYDLVPITPKTWQEVDLSYSDIIKGKKYPAEIKLLRPIEWLKKYGMNEVGNQVKFSIPEFGIVNIVATVKDIKPTKIDTSTIDWSKQDSRPVIGTFKRYTTDVRTYTFTDKHGNIEKINATPNHKFYVKNKKKFMPIEDVEPIDQLVSQTGKQLRLFCPTGKIKNCGVPYNENHKPVIVYNLEVYKEHVYRVGNNGILVHNQYLLKLSESDHIKHFRMDETQTLLKGNNDTLVTTGLNSCSAVAICSRNEIIMTHLRGTNMDYVDPNFIENISKLAKQDTNLSLHLYSPTIFSKSSADSYLEHIIEKLSNEGIDTRKIWRSIWYKSVKSSHAFGAKFHDNIQLLGEIDIYDDLTYKYIKDL